MKTLQILYASRLMVVVNSSREGLNNSISSPIEEHKLLIIKSMTFEKLIYSEDS